MYCILEIRIRSVSLAHVHSVGVVWYAWNSEVAMSTEPQKWQLDTPYAEQNPIIVHNIIHIQTIIISCCAARSQRFKLPIIFFIAVKFPNPYSFRSVPVAL